MSWVRDRTQLIYRMTDELELRGYKYGENIMLDFMTSRRRKCTSISLFLSQFITLYMVNDQILKSIRYDEDFIYDLGDNVNVTFQKFKNKASIGLRQYYLANDGEMRPGKWGVNISPIVWKRTISPRLDKIRK